MSVGITKNKRIFLYSIKLQSIRIKPIFHRKLGSRWVPNAKEIYTKNMKYTWPTPAFCVGTQRNLYSTDWRRGLALGLTQILGLASGNANFHILDTNMLVFPTQKSGVGGTAQRQPPTPGILRSGGIKALVYFLPPHTLFLLYFSSTFFHCDIDF